MRGSNRRSGSIRPASNSKLYLLLLPPRLIPCIREKRANPSVLSACNSTFFGCQLRRAAQQTASALLNAVITTANLLVCHWDLHTCLGELPLCQHPCQLCASSRMCSYQRNATCPSAVVPLLAHAIAYASSIDAPFSCRLSISRWPFVKMCILASGLFVPRRPAYCLRDQSALRRMAIHHAAIFLLPCFSLD
jgi:hypothetical protein